jgi:uncharacterized protein
MIMNLPLKIGILSDTHGFIHEDVIDIISQCDVAIHAGDIIDAQTLLQLNPKKKLIAVQGNNDSHLAQLKDTESIELPGGALVVNHGHTYGHHKPSHDLLREAYADAKVVVYGHTHKQVIDQERCPWVVNPGAAGMVRNHGGSKCLVIDINIAHEWVITPYTFS